MKTPLSRVRAILHRFSIILFGSAYLMVSVLLQRPLQTSGLIRECTEAYLRDIGATTIKCNDSTVCPATALAQRNNATQNKVASGTLYMLGDSITNGANLKYREAINPKGITSFINAVGGRSWIWPGSGAAGAYTPEAGGSQEGKDGVVNDSEVIHDASGIVIALGSNGGLEANPIDEIIGAIREYNTSAPIWWVNIVKTNDDSTNYGDFNRELETKSQDSVHPFKVINWFNAVAPTQDKTSNGRITETNNYLISDGLHPNSTGQDALVKLVTDEVLGSGTGNETVAGCVCSTTSGTLQLEPSAAERYARAWAFFTDSTNGAGMSAEAAAGIMGNLDAESKINPFNVQDSANRRGIPDGPEIPFDAYTNDGVPFKDNFGYGIAQWTSVGRQQHLIAFAAQNNASTGNLDLQLDFLLTELTESYTGVLAVLQTPGVTVAQAAEEVVVNFEGPATTQLPPRGHGTPETKQEEIRVRTEKAQIIYNTYVGTSGGYTPGPSCGGTGDGSATVVDPDADNQDAIGCADGTTTASESTSGYSNGKEKKIRTCNANGYIVNSQISGQTLAMTNAMKQAGLTVGGSNFRSLQEQINLYKQRCQEQGIVASTGPFPYPERSSSDHAKNEQQVAAGKAARDCARVADPGYSNHGMGFAIDFTCNGAGIPQTYESAKNNQCFQWLLSNSQQYNYYESTKGQSRNSDEYEGWHWSITGG